MSTYFLKIIDFYHFYMFIYQINDKYCYYVFDFECCVENYNCCFCNDVDNFISQCQIDNINDLYNDIINNTFLFDEIDKNDFNNLF